MCPAEFMQGTVVSSRIKRIVSEFFEVLPHTLAKTTGTIDWGQLFLGGWWWVAGLGHPLGLDDQWDSDLGKRPVYAADLLLLKGVIDNPNPVKSGNVVPKNDV